MSAARGSAAARAVRHELPEALPTGPSRSIAWADRRHAFGERVITGLAEGVSLRLDGESFTARARRWAAREQRPRRSRAQRFGAAFAKPDEGLAGLRRAAGPPDAARRAPSASRPGRCRSATRCSRSRRSRARPSARSPAKRSPSAIWGEVARYKPGEGWLPESLLGPGGARGTRRGCARSRGRHADRAYAVGDGRPRMWLWRGETGLWEPDPATPLNFRGNLLGIAFDPSNPARGYAVGSRAGGACCCATARPGRRNDRKRCPPPGRTGASFTSIAFAGSEAIVAYRSRSSAVTRPVRRRAASSTTARAGRSTRKRRAGRCGADAPRAVAGLPDGGAAFAAIGGEGGRACTSAKAPGAPWQADADAAPRRRRPGPLALFRESGALRAIVGGQRARHVRSAKANAGRRPGPRRTYIAPYPLGANAGRGVLRQTADRLERRGARTERRRRTRRATGASTTCLSARPRVTRCWSTRRRAGLGGRRGYRRTQNRTRSTPPTSSATRPKRTRAARRRQPRRIAVDAASETRPSRSAAARSARRRAPTAPRRHRARRVAVHGARTRASRSGVRAFLYTGPRVTSRRDQRPTKAP